MRVRTALVIVMIMLAIVPNLIVAQYAKGQFEDASRNTLEAYINNDTELCAVYMEKFFKNIISEAKSVTSSNTVKEAMYLTTTVDSIDVLTDETMVGLSAVAKSIVSGSDVFTLVHFITTDGVIIASSNKSYIGYNSFSYIDMDTASTSYNGIGTLEVDDDGNYYTTVTRRIYYSGSQKVGLFYAKISLNNLIEYFDTVDKDDNIATYMIDTLGQYYENEAKTIRYISVIREFSEIESKLSPVTSYNEDATDTSVTFSYNYNNTTKNVYAIAINTCGWAIVRSTPEKYYSTFTTAPDKSSRTFMIIVTVIIIIFAVVACIFFTKPLDHIIDIIRRRKRGEETARLEPHGLSEYSEISQELNDMFDNVFENEQRYRSVVSMNDNIIFEVNLQLGTVFVSRNFNKRFSLRPKDDSIASSFLYKLKIFKEDQGKFKYDVEAVLQEDNKWEGEYRILDSYGNFAWTKIKAEKKYDRYNKPYKIIGMISDIDKTKRSEINLVQKASYDALTQLYNRQTFMNVLEAEIKRSAAKGTLDALFFIDLDDFKHFNDEYGHACGDEVLQFVAETIKTITLDKGFGGRMGGDEFLFCLNDLTLIGDAGKAAQELIDTLASGFDSESTGMRHAVHCSVGIAFFRENGNTPDELQEAADAAMYNIKKRGKSNFAYAEFSDKL